MYLICKRAFSLNRQQKEYFQVFVSIFAEGYKFTNIN